jgi:hypothetical protein
MTNVKAKELVLTGISKHCFVNVEGKPIILKKEFPEFDKVLRKMAE